ncbi:MAG: hypothetical protein WAL26_09975 [Mycobacterium sp.]
MLTHIDLAGRSDFKLLSENNRVGFGLVQDVRYGHAAVSECLVAFDNHEIGVPTQDVVSLLPGPERN